MGYLSRLKNSKFKNANFAKLKFTASTSTALVLSNGTVLVGGGQLNYASVTGRNYLAAINSDGTTNNAYNILNIDTKFSAGVASTALQSDGKVLIGGSFSKFLVVQVVEIF